jgi:sulfatase maturation enzyme AslB (radical SAM superfamily)
MIQLQIETTSTCSAACHFCVYPTSDRKGGLMTKPLYEKIIEEAATIELIDTITLVGLGEPTLDPHLESRLAFARARTPQVRLEIYTNGSHLTPARFDALRAAGLSSIVFSLNAVRPEQHESIMGLKGKFDQICATIDHAIATRGDCALEIHAVANPDRFTMDDCLTFYERWGKRDEGGYGQAVYEGNWSGGNRLIRSFKANECCARALRQIYVMYDGRVSTCCFDPTGKQIFGDLKTQSIREIYSGVDYVKFREAHFADKADRYAICKACTRI